MSESEITIKVLYTPGFLWQESMLLEKWFSIPLLDHTYHLSVTTGAHHYGYGATRHTVTDRRSGFPRREFQAPWSEICKQQIKLHKPKPIQRSQLYAAFTHSESKRQVQFRQRSQVWWIFVSRYWESIKNYHRQLDFLRFEIFITFFCFRWPSQVATITILVCSYFEMMNSFHL